MNFVGKFDAKLPVEGSVPHPVAFAHVDGASTHAPADAILVPDAQLLFGGDFKRSGVDLVLSKDDHEVVFHDYFKGEKRAALASPDGAHLTGDLVNALTGHVDYAQADGAAAAAAIVVGHVTKLSGSATAIRNGVSIILNQGDNIDKGDVLQSGADSTLGVTFIDGTVFGLSSNARMVVNEMIYDPNGSNNTSLMSLVAGTISFVAGETAKHGDMKVDTPVATMGIRGTAVLVEIDFAVPGQGSAPSANFQVLVEPDGTTGSYILFDKNTLAPLATVNAAGTLTKISQGVVSFQTGTPLTPDEQKLINDLFTTKFGDNNNPKSTDHAFTDTPVPQSLAPIKSADGTTATPVVVVVANSGGSSSSSSGSGTSSGGHIPGAPTVVTFNDAFTEHANITGSTAFDTATAKIRFADPNAGDLPTVKVEFSSFAYQDAHHNDIKAALSPHEQASIAAIEAISVQQDPGNKNVGSATWTYSYPDGAFDFLGAGETLTLTYTAVVNNNFALNPEINRTQTFTVTITGTNDVPVITSSIPQTIAFVGGTSVPGGDLTAHVPTSGTIGFDDPDLTDTHTVSVKLLLDGLNLPPAPLQIFEKALTASIATDSTGTGAGTGTVNWKLADLPVYLADFIPKGETITLTYAVTVTDSQGATSTQDITVTITGTDTPAVVWIATTETGSAPGGLWSDASNWETGTVPTATDDAIIITDQLIGLTPSYPVTIDAETAAVAKSVTMNDFGTSPPVLINLGTLTVGGAFNMSADSILHNSGTISVGGLMEVQDSSVLLNSGALILQQGGDFKDQSTITNTDTGSIEISGGTLTVQTDVTNDGLITVDSSAALTVSIATVTGGTVTNNGTLLLNGVAQNGAAPSDPTSGDGFFTAAAVLAPAAGVAMLKDGTLNNADVLDAGTGAVLQNETVSNTGTIEILADGALTLDQGTTVDNTEGTITIDGTGTLTLDDAIIDGGILDAYSTADGGIISGVIDVTGSSTISNAQLNNRQVTVEGDQILTLDGSMVTGSTITNNGTLVVDADRTLTLQGGASIVGGTLDNLGTVNIEGSSGALLDGVTVTGGGDIQIDFEAVTVTATTPLVLEGGTTITDGTLTVGSFGALDVKTTGATLDDVAVTNKNSIEVFSESALTLDDGTSVTNIQGTITIDDAGALTLNDATISGGHLNNSGTIYVEGPSNATLDGVTIAGSGHIQIDSDSDLDAGTNTDADTAPTTLVLEGGTAITGGTLTVGSIGVLDVKTVAGATLDDVGVTNTNSIEVFGDSTLTLVHGTSVTNTGGTITVGGTATLTLNDATISGGTIDDYSVVSGSTVAGDIDVTASSTISNAHLNNGRVTIGSDTTLTLSGDTVSGTSFIDTASGATILIDGASTLDGVSVTGGTITNADATLTVDADQTLTLQGGAVVVGGTVSNSGTIAIEGSSGATLDGVAVSGDGTIQVDVAVATSTPLVLKDGTTVTGGKLKVGSVGAVAVKTVSGAGLNGVAVTNDNSIEVFAASILALASGTVIDNTGGVLTIDGTAALTLSQATINGGTINNYSAPLGSTVAGDIDVTGSSTISNAYLHNGQVTIGTNATLTLDGTTLTNTVFADTASGAVIQIGGGTTLTVDHATINGGTINDYSGTSDSVVAGDINVTGSSKISNAHLNNGQVTIEANQTLTLDGVTVTGTHFVDTADGATIQIDGGTTLTLDHATIDGGTINDFSTVSNGIVAGSIDVIGASTISNAHINHGNVTIESGETLTLDGDTVMGTAFTGIAADSIIHLDGGDSLTLNGATVNGGGLTIGADALVKTSGDVTLTNTVVINDGTIEITGGTLKIAGSVASSGPDAGGSIKIDSGAVLDLDAADSQTIAFAGANAELKIEASSFNGSISGLAATDQIDLSTIGYGPGTTGTYSGGVLTITDGAHSISMTLTGDYSDAHFAGASDGHGGTLITLHANDDVPVFAETAETAAVTELANTTGSSALDPSTAASGTLHFTDIDLTDRPTATITQTVTWTSGEADLSSSLTPAEISALEQAFSLAQSGNTNNGAIGWSYQISDNALDFLSAGETATVTSTVLLDDHQSGHDTATVTLTITGANDAPVLVADTSGAGQSGAHAIAELAGKTGDATDIDIASATLSFTDADLNDTHIVSHSGPTYALSDGTLSTTEAAALTAAAQLTLSEIDSTHSGVGSVAFSYGAPDSSFDFLAEGQTLAVSYTIIVTDNSGVSSSQPVTLTITGSNDAPVLTTDSSGTSGQHAVTELAGKTGDIADVDSSSGTLSFTDVDLSDTHTVSQQAPVYAWSGGSLTTAQTDALTAAATLTLNETDSTHTGSGSIGFTYSAADSSFDFLAAGETLKVTYGVAVTDNHDASSIQPVTITITGTNDAPVLASDQSGANGTTLHAISEIAGKTGDADDQDSASGTLSFVDADIDDSHSLSHGGPSYALSNGTLTATEADALTAAAQLSLNELDSTHSGSGSVNFSYSAPDSSFDFLAEGQTLTVSYSITVTDNSGVSSSQPVTFTITGSNDAPVVDAHDAALAYTENQAPTAIDAALTLSDVDSTTLGSATVQISDHFAAGEDVLGFTDQNGIHGSYDAATGVLSLTGTASVANYQAALASVTYFDNSDNPSSAPRTVSFSVDDGASANSHSNIATATVDVTPVESAAVSTTTLTFDNLPSSGSGVPIPQGYGGLDWSNFYELDSQAYYTASGYANGTVSAPNVAFNGFGDTASVSAATFNFVGADLTGAWNNGLSITVYGYDHDVLVDQKTVVVDSSAPTCFEFGFNGITNLVFSSSGGTSAGYDGGGAHFVLDDFTYSILPNPNVSIAAGGSFEIESASADKVVFAGSTGTLVLDDPSSFTGKIAGISGNGDVLDLGGFDAAQDRIVGTTGSGSYDSTTGITSLTVTDETTKHSVTLNLAGDYSSSTWTVTGDGHGGANVVDPPTPNSATVATGASLEISSGAASADDAASSENITFQGSTGTLTLDHPSNFTGTISGFTGDGTLSGSDRIDLKGIDHNSASFAESYDASTNTLSVSDGSHNAVLHFNGSYQAANFSFTTDNMSGTIVYDPPVNSDASSKALAVTATGQGFVFNFADNGHGATSAEQRASGTYMFDGHTFVNAEVDLNGLHDEDQGHAVMGPAGSDSPSVAAIKAQLHVHDLHFV